MLQRPARGVIPRRLVVDDGESKRDGRVMKLVGAKVGHNGQPVRTSSGTILSWSKHQLGINTALILADAEPITSLTFYHDVRTSDMHPASSTTLAGLQGITPGASARDQQDQNASSPLASSSEVDGVPTSWYHAQCVPFAHGVCTRLGQLDHLVPEYRLVNVC